ncbi:MAG: YicC family protein [Bacteroidales bacterium]|nr:YicC family protein [Bacteroidales bacterium]MBP5367354.1 YicC family protein [Bacteroidales bacterium]
MMKSMTGFGKAAAILNGKNYEIEIKSLNGKSLDINTKLPANYKERELEMRSIIGERLERGKIDFSLTITVVSGGEAVKVNEELLASYFNTMSQITDRLNFKPDQTQLFTTLLRFPDVLRNDPEPLDENEWEFVKALLIKAVDALDNFRTQEGQNLKGDFVKRTNLILEYLSRVEPFEKQRVAQIKERIAARFEELKGLDVDRNRFEQELIYYIEKLDITEEKIRLKNHCNYFIETIDAQEAPGKKLGFIAQEMGREINTLGSKANDSDIQKIVVMMKDELEKIKEQVLNIL